MLGLRGKELRTDGVKPVNLKGNQENVRFNCHSTYHDSPQFLDNFVRE